MQLRALLLAVCAALLAAVALFPVHALHADEFRSDFFHREYVGTPRAQTLLPDGALLTLTDANVLASIAADGAVAWRRPLPEGETPLALHTHRKSALTVSAAPSADAGAGAGAGQSGARLRLWFTDRGDLIWEQDLAALARSQPDATAEERAETPAAAPVLAASARALNVTARVAAARAGADSSSTAWDALFTGADEDGDTFSEVAALHNGRVFVLSGISGKLLWSWRVPQAVQAFAAARLTMLHGQRVLALVAAPRAPAAGLFVFFPAAPATPAWQPLALATPAAVRSFALIHATAAGAGAGAGAGAAAGAGAGEGVAKAGDVVAACVLAAVDPTVVLVPLHDANTPRAPAAAAADDARPRVVPGAAPHASVEIPAGAVMQSLLPSVALAFAPQAVSGLSLLPGAQRGAAQLHDVAAALTSAGGGIVVVAARLAPAGAAPAPARPVFKPGSGLAGPPPAADPNAKPAAVAGAPVVVGVVVAALPGADSGAAPAVCYHTTVSTTASTAADASSVSAVAAVPGAAAAVLVASLPAVLAASAPFAADIKAQGDEASPDPRHSALARALALQPALPFTAGRGAPRACVVGAARSLTLITADGSVARALPAASAAAGGYALSWLREEALAAVVAARFVPFPAAADATGTAAAAAAAAAADTLAVSGGLAQRLAAIARTLLPGAGATRATTRVPPQTRPPHAAAEIALAPAAADMGNATLAAAAVAGKSAVSRDAFGFRQALVLAAASGLVTALDTATGATLWRRFLPAPAPAGQQRGVLSLRHAALWGAADLALVVDWTPLTGAATVTAALRVDPFTGALLPAPRAPWPAPPARGEPDALFGPDVAVVPFAPRAVVAAPAPSASAFRAAFAAAVAREAAGKPAILSGAALSDNAAAAFAAAVRSGSSAASPAAPARTALLFVTKHASRAVWALAHPALAAAVSETAWRERQTALAVVASLVLPAPVHVSVVDAVAGAATGLRIEAVAPALRKAETSPLAVATVAWTRAIPAGARIVASSTSSSASVDVVGAAARSAGDGRGGLLPKHVDRHLLALATLAQGGALSVALVDAVTGATADAVSARGAATGPVTALLAEHALTVTYFSLARAQHEMLVVELFAPAADAAQAPATTYRAGALPRPVAVEQSYTLPWGGARAGAVTRTQHGIASRDLLYATEAGRVVALPRSLADARRAPPVPGAPPAAAPLESEEALVPYAPALAVPDASLFSLNLTLPRASLVVAAPTGLESTCVVAVAGGPDVFVRRAAPSARFDVLADDFDYVFLLVTVFGVAAATLWAHARLKAKLAAKEWR